jgi:hypothetical protein
MNNRHHATASSILTFPLTHRKEEGPYMYLVGCYVDNLQQSNKAPIIKKNVNNLQESNKFIYI